MQFGYSLFWDSPQILYSGSWFRSSEVQAMETVEEGAYAEVVFSARNFTVFGAIPPASQGPSPTIFVSFLSPDGTSFASFQQNHFGSENDWSTNQILFTIDDVQRPDVFAAPRTTARLTHMVGGSHTALQQLVFAGNDAPIIFPPGSGPAVSASSNFPTTVSTISIVESSPPPEPSNSFPGSDSSDSNHVYRTSLSPGVIAGIVCGSLAFIALLSTLLAWRFLRRKPYTQLRWEGNSRNMLDPFAKSPPMHMTLNDSSAETVARFPMTATVQSKGSHDASSGENPFLVRNVGVAGTSLSRSTSVSSQPSIYSQSSASSILLPPVALPGEHGYLSPAYDDPPEITKPLHSNISRPEGIRF
ncbi:hypothetical protein CC1G_11357 [Coprinopsis cinerea okayama7|uniref:Transmembrane protein n=1 Tax=Coprinopsis cinerea (strain Okayama-7 / 130 / ATCC MYA-4618 / FGSC 9003) TaxID=240176 RepID=A8P8V9_COPC7|nr:hypothetical protein CC1G_11357 [Coprinopsis cinerea okayama7\|eukprot:XP_001839646.2 hypothetical protein CC1G_11357 [Coprinopsis cinerea okayama7\